MGETNKLLHVCENCGSTSTESRGQRKRGSVIMQKRICNRCGHNFYLKANVEVNAEDSLERFFDRSNK